MEGGIGAVPWIGTGWTLLEALGSVLPRSFWEGRVDIATSYGNRVRRVHCLLAAGYTLEQVRDIIKAETGDTIRIGHDTTPSRIYWDMARKIERGETTQEQLLAQCTTGYEQPYITRQEIEGGRRIVFVRDPETGRTVPQHREWEERPGERFTPPVTQALLPGTTGPPSRPPYGGRSDPPSLLQALLLLIARIIEWQRRGRQDIRIFLPGGGRMPALAGVPGGRPDMAYINTSILGGETGWGGLMSQALRTAATIWGPNQALPGGARTAGMGFAQPALFDLPGIDIVGQGQGACMGQLTSPFAAGSGRGARAKTHVQCDPISGRPVWFKPAGRPILWSGDLSACKRVRKVAARARRARGGR